MAFSLARISGLAGTISLLAVAAVSAQQAEPFALDPIVVYGDRTTSLAEESTGSVTVVEEEELESPTVSSYRDTFRRTVNVEQGDLTESGFVIRGVNSEGQTPGGLGTPLASFYVDGVQQTVEGTRRGFRGVFEAEQVEIYRGPQSTLSGRSALAGAIYVKTTDPQFAREGRMQLTYGEDNRRQVGVMFNEAVGDTLAFRFAGEWSDKDTDLNFPSYEQYDRYDDLASEEFYTFRGKVLWQPAGSDATEVLLSYSRSFDSPTPDLIAGAQRNPSAGVDLGDRRGDIWGALTPAGYAQIGLAEAPFYQDVRETTVDNLGLEVTHDITANLTFTAMTGWSHSVTDRNSVNEGTPGETSYVSGEFDQELLTQEFRFNYDTESLRWVAGAYASREEQEAFRDQVVQNPFIGTSFSENTAEIDNLALFGEVSYEFAPDWRVIAGGRVDHIRQERNASLEANGAVTDSSTSFDDTVFIPKVGIQYEINLDQTVTLMYQEGYRPGGSGIQTSSATEYTYEPEEAKNLELSWRGSFMEDRLDVAAAVFYQDWDNQQIEIWEDPDESTTSFVANAGESNSYGAEVSLRFAASERLDIVSSLGLLRTEFEEFTVSNEDFSGLDFPSAPEQSFALGFRWGEETGWFGTGNVKTVSSFLSRLEAGIGGPARLDGYTTVDVSAGYAWDEVRLTAYATNLFDEEYEVYAYEPDQAAALGDRREIGVRLDYTF